MQIKFGKLANFIRCGAAKHPITPTIMPPKLKHLRVFKQSRKCLKYYLEIPNVLPRIYYKKKDVKKKEKNIKKMVLFYFNVILHLSFSLLLYV